MTTHRRTSG